MCICACVYSRGHAGDNENTAMPAGSVIITVISGMTGSIVDQLNNPGRDTSEIDAKPDRPTQSGFESISEFYGIGKYFALVDGIMESRVVCQILA